MKKKNFFRQTEIQSWQLVDWWCRLAWTNVKEDWILKENLNCVKQANLQESKNTVSFSISYLCSYNFIKTVFFLSQIFFFLFTDLSSMFDVLMTSWSDWFGWCVVDMTDQDYRSKCKSKQFWKKYWRHTSLKDFTPPSLIFSDQIDITFHQRS